MAHARPTMLSTRATANSVVARGRRKPSDAASAVAQTASRAPERTRTSQYMAVPIRPSCRCAGTAPSSAARSRALAPMVGDRCTRPKSGVARRRTVDEPCIRRVPPHYREMSVRFDHPGPAMSGDYLDFDIALTREGQGYAAHVLDSPAGQASTPFTLPFGAADLARFMVAVGPPRVTSRRLVPAESRVVDVREYGRRLADALLAGDVGRAFRDSLATATAQGRDLRLRLRLDAVPDLDPVPWEYLYDKGLERFVALSQETPVVRLLDALDRPPVVTVEPPLRVLVMVSSPSDLEPLAVDREKQLLRATTGDLVAAGLLEVVVVEDATLISLQRALLDGYHVFHFIGHGGFDDQAQEGLPAVVAMQTEISDRAALVFSHEFYWFLTRGLGIDAAMCEVRKAMAVSDEAAEWGTAVLLRSGSDQPFAFTTSATAVTERPDSRLESLYDAAKGALLARAPATALPLLEQIAAEHPDYQDVTQLLERVRPEAAPADDGPTPRSRPELTLTQPLTQPLAQPEAQPE